MKIWINSHSIQRSSSDFGVLIDSDGGISRSRRPPVMELELKVTVVEHGTDEMSLLRDAWRNGEECHLIDDATFRNLTMLAERALTLEAGQSSHLILLPRDERWPRIEEAVAQPNERMTLRRHGDFSSITRMSVPSMEPTPVKLTAALASGTNATGVSVHDPKPETPTEKPTEKELPRTRFDLLEVD